MHSVMLQPAKTSVSPRSSPMGTFHAEERLRLSGRNSILMMQINVYIITRQSWGSKHKFVQFCVSSGRFWYSVVFICERAPAKLKRFFQRRVYSTNIDCFARDSSPLHLTFVAFCLLSVIRKQWLKQCNYSVDQSALLTGFRTDLTSSGLHLTV